MKTVSRIEIRPEIISQKERGSIMKMYRAVTTTLSAAIVGMLLVPAASACDMAQQPAVALVMGQIMRDSRNPLELATSASLARDLSSAAIGKTPSLVGMWSFQFVSLGNNTR